MGYERRDAADMLDDILGRPRRSEQKVKEEEVVPFLPVQERQEKNQPAKQQKTVIDNSYEPPMETHAQDLRGLPDRSVDLTEPTGVTQEESLPTGILETDITGDPEDGDPESMADNLKAPLRKAIKTGDFAAAQEILDLMGSFRKDLRPEALLADRIRAFGDRRAGRPSRRILSDSGVFDGEKRSPYDISTARDARTFAKEMKKGEAGRANRGLDIRERTAQAAQDQAWENGQRANMQFKLKLIELENIINEKPIVTSQDEANKRMEASLRPLVRNINEMKDELATLSDPSMSAFTKKHSKVRMNTLRQNIADAQRSYTKAKSQFRDSLSRTKKK